MLNKEGDRMIEEFQATLKIPLLENQIRKLLIRVVELTRENKRLRIQIQIKDLLEKKQG